MDAALLTQRYRNQAVALAPKVKATDKSNATTLASQQAGAGTFWVNGLPQGGCDCTPPSGTPAPLDPNPLQTTIFNSLEYMFQYISRTNAGPTRASRFLYLWMSTVTAAYRWVQPTSPLTGVVDGWNWTTSESPTPIVGDNTIAVWMTQVLAYTMPFLAPPLTAAQVLQFERTLRGWSALEQATQAGFAKETGRFPLWRAAWTAWYARRQQDGATQAAAAPTFDQLPNGGLLLDTDVCQDITAYPQPYQWTPLVIGGRPKPYATRTWENVSSVVLTATDGTAVKTTATPFFPGYNTAARQQELNTLIDMTAMLGIPGTFSDTQKITAEFWAGGPFTVTPPGMFMWLWRQYGLAFQVATKQTRGYETLLYSGLDLAINLFEMGRLAWGIKLQYQEARPIQDIRRNYPLTDLSGWRTTVDPATQQLRPAADVSGCLWLPYQEPTFVTPPFPDFISGHSAYSKVFASVMSGWFGPTFPPSAPTVAADLPLFSPIFTTIQTLPFGVFQVNPGASEIQPAIVPAAPVTLTFSTFQQFADSAGLSRQWGGIHALSAHTGGQAAASTLYARVQNNLSLSTMYTPV
jgi:hypothetical protein